ncbi:response regulator transcription factor [Actinophytocola oryzae]|uniref:DNA-binding response OmpR family regulator n=1 Tax=Actinophytocola oryzae TaxID=502181 RepID=A0A4R7W3P4_9PSEU|nr:response regulator transcription factor [Actinophytocola oryzae]TDV57290.1 DNA-binding response OmpR family regulator [Actinophytocola oryzae]
MAAIALAEDDVKQAELVRRYLEREHHTVIVAADGRAALEAVRRERFDLLVLDLMLPVLDGLEVCRILRGEGAGLLIMMLTARSTEDDLLRGLDHGADDYLTKPFSPRELVARVRTLLRRARPFTTPDPVLRVGPLTVDPLRHEVTSEGRPVPCTPGEFRLLAALAAQPDRVFTREQLLDSMHGFDSYLTDRTIDMHVLNLRKKIEREPRRPVHLVTVYGVGYKLTGGPGAG